MQRQPLSEKDGGRTNKSRDGGVEREKIEEKRRGTRKDDAEERGNIVVRDSKVDERVGSHVDVKDRNCEFVDPRVE